jgi:hypothetical protein
VPFTLPTAHTDEGPLAETADRLPPATLGARTIENPLGVAAIPAPALEAPNTKHTTSPDTHPRTMTPYHLTAGTPMQPYCRK